MILDSAIHDGSCKTSVYELTELLSGSLFCNSILNSWTALSATGFLLLFLGSPISTCKRVSSVVGPKRSAMNPGPGSQRILTGGHQDRGTVPL